MNLISIFPWKKAKREKRMNPSCFTRFLLKAPFFLSFLACVISSSALFSCSEQYIYALVDGIYDLTFYEKTDNNDIFTVSEDATFTIATVYFEPPNSIAHWVKAYTDSEGNHLKTWQTFVLADPFLDTYHYYLSTAEYNYLYLRAYDDAEILKYYLFGKRCNSNENIMTMSYVDFHVARPDKTQIASTTFSLRTIV